MNHHQTGADQLFRLWLATYSDWQPSQWNDVPPTARALEVVEQRAYSAGEAALYLAGFNGAILGCEQPIWAVAVPVTIRYDGDARPGERVEGFRFDLPP